MAVYVDDLFMVAHVGRRRSCWCHLVADTTEELHALAQRIGLRREWFQEGGHALPHYDVTLSKRLLAVAAGAVEIDREQLVAMIHAHRQVGRVG